MPPIIGAGMIMRLQSARDVSAGRECKAEQALNESQPY